MKTVIPLILIAFVAYSIDYKAISPTAGVCLVGGAIKADNSPTIKKYKRKDCPVCKGKGWYISGDGIAKVDCGYCEPEKESNVQAESEDDCPSCKTKIFRG